MYGKSNTETYITTCTTDSNRNLLCAQETQTGVRYQPRGGMGMEMGGRFKREGIYVYL